MTTTQRTAPNIAANDSIGVVVGPFEWTPSQVGHECLFFSVSAMDDPSNIDGRITGSIPEWRLVPHDNNIAQRNVHPVAISLSAESLRNRLFWLRNPFEYAVQVKLAAQLPAFLRERGWRLDFISPGAGSFRMKAGAIKEIQFVMSGGQAIERSNLPSADAERTILITGEADGIPLGGMTYVLDPDYAPPTPQHPSCPQPPPAENAPCAEDASQLLKCLRLEGAEVKSVDVRRISIDIAFKGKCD